jgi:hypothetical protein
MADQFGHLERFHADEEEVVVVEPTTVTADEAEAPLLSVETNIRQASRCALYETHRFGLLAWSWPSELNRCIPLHALVCQGERTGGVCGSMQRCDCRGYFTWLPAALPMGRLW